MQYLQLAEQKHRINKIYFVQALTCKFMDKLLLRLWFAGHPASWVHGLGPGGAYVVN
jgi:hypothetical protein